MDETLSSTVITARGGTYGRTRCQCSPGDTRFDNGFLQFSLGLATNQMGHIGVVIRPVLRVSDVEGIHQQII